jgi:chromosome segregation ATPase
MEREFRAPNGSQRLFDICTYSSPQARLGFYFVLNNTLVCQNLDKAREINSSQREKFRIVTLDGSTLLPNGSI